jgi:hypothetical protein
MDSHRFEMLFPRSLTTPPRTGSNEKRKRNLKTKKTRTNTQSEKIAIGIKEEAGYS